MAERVFRIVAGELVQIEARDPLLRYKYKSHPIDRDNVYVELTAAENAQADKDAADHEVTRQRPVPPSLEERIASLEARPRENPRTSP